MWKAVSDREELCWSGIMRLTQSGHGVLYGMYRKPHLIDGVPYYRFNKDEKSCFRKVEKLLDDYFPGHGMVIDDYWYRLIRHLVAKHNLQLKMQYAREYDELEKERRRVVKPKPIYPENDEQIHDAFQNDIWAG